MKAIIISVIAAFGLFAGTGMAFAEDITVTYAVRQANCPSVDSQYVTQSWANGICTRVYHR